MFRQFNKLVNREFQLTIRKSKLPAGSYNLFRPCAVLPSASVSFDNTPFADGLVTLLQENQTPARQREEQRCESS
jgi:hypothetical protein